MVYRLADLPPTQFIPHSVAGTGALLQVFGENPRRRTVTVSPAATNPVLMVWGDGPGPTGTLTLPTTAGPVTWSADTHADMIARPLLIFLPVGDSCFVAEIVEIPGS